MTKYYVTGWVTNSVFDYDLKTIGSFEELDSDSVAREVQFATECEDATIANAVANGLARNYNAHDVKVEDAEEFLHRYDWTSNTENAQEFRQMVEDAQIDTEIELANAFL